MIRLPSSPSVPWLMLSEYIEYIVHHTTLQCILRSLHLQNKRYCAKLHSRIQIMFLAATCPVYLSLFNQMSYLCIPRPSNSLTVQFIHKRLSCEHVGCSCCSRYIFDEQCPVAMLQYKPCTRHCCWTPGV